MSTWRKTNLDECPLDDTPALMSVCSECRYFRGASSASHEPRGWQINCNWPRDGAYVAPLPVFSGTIVFRDTPWVEALIDD
jgi:hypothetical protein